MKYQFDESIDKNGRKKHNHSLDGKPLIGTSTVINKVLNKPLLYYASGFACQEMGMNNYKLFGKIKSKEATEEEVKEMYVKLGIKFEEIKKLTLEEYYKLLDKAYRAHNTNKENKADDGTKLHEELERYVKNTMTNRMPTPLYNDKIIPFIEWSDKNVKRFIASEAHCFSSKLWTGGITDCIAELNNEKIVILDFKSSDKAYDNQFIQTGGYAYQIDENGLWDKNGKYNKKIPPINEMIIFPFGAKEVKSEIKTDVQTYKKAFEYAVGLYKILELRFKDN